MNASRDHWEGVYRGGNHDRVGWYQPHPAMSLAMLGDCGVAPDAPIIDIGGGSSFLVDRLLEAGHTDVTVLDLSATALELARERLGDRARRVNWIEGDVTSHDFGRVYQVWHDRAAFHFLIEEDRQNLYMERLVSTVAPDGCVVVGAFALDGPERCSGLPVQRYGEASLADRLGAQFDPIEFRRETHVTPGGVEQKFLFGRFRRVS